MIPGVRTVELILAPNCGYIIKKIGLHSVAEKSAEVKELVAARIFSNAFFKVIH